MNPDILFFFLKTPGKRTASRFPNRAPMEREIPFYRVFCMYLENLIKIHLNRKAL